MDNLSVASNAARSVGAASISSTFSRGILKKKTMQESLESDHSLSNHSLATCVTFDFVEYYEHPITLGVNPAVGSGGPPIEIEWQCQAYETTTVDDFEQAREGFRTTAKKLGAEARIELLLQAGFSREELTKSEDEVSDVRLLREMSRRRRVRRCNSAPPATTVGSTSNRSRDKGNVYGMLIKKFRLKRCESKLENMQ